MVQQYVPGQMVEATVTRLASFGVFARVLEGVEGLIHISELANERIAHPKQVVQVGDTVTVRILAIDPSRHRLSLSLRQARQTEMDAGPAGGDLQE
jgi:small subunit ribosomal protein S1